MSMKRTTVDGKTVNARTARMLALWEFNALRKFYVVQGSYNAGGVRQSAGTHDGGGAVDLSTYGWGSLKEKKWIVKQGRLAGFMAYLRPTIPGLWNEHVHAGALGDWEASSGLKDQFQDYRNGRDALASNGPDPDPRVRIRVFPKVRRKRVNALVAYLQFRTKNPKPRMTVARIQWVLNEKAGTNLRCDGIAGPVTRDAFKKWERKSGAPKADGVPGKPSLNKLGKGRFVARWFTYEKFHRSRQNTAEAVQDAFRAEEKSPTFPN